MEKDKELSSFNHSISVVERKNILITGVKKVDSFDNEEFLVETIMGYLALKGQDLELVKLDTIQGSVTIKGLVNSFDYIEDSKKQEKEGSFISRLFKWVYLYKLHPLQYHLSLE